jgi:hypothetical protein
MDNYRKHKTVTYKRIKEISSKLDEKNINNPRFDLNYQSNMLEIDNRLKEPSSHNKMEFLRNRFRSDMNEISKNIMREVEIQAKEPVMK